MIQYHMKDNLRTSVMKKRDSLTNIKVKENSEKIKKLVFKMNEFKKAKKILFYLSYGSEVNTHDMIKECISSDKIAVVPKTYVKNKRLLLSELSNWNHLEIGIYNILEPKKKYLREVSIESIDLMIIPGIVFDISGNRIGHGLGYYDILLKNYNKKARIGLAYELQIVNNIPAEPHDVKVNKIVTEERAIDCSKIM